MIIKTKRESLNKMKELKLNYFDEDIFTVKDIKGIEEFFKRTNISDYYITKEGKVANIKTENGFNIADLQTEQLIAEEDYQTFSELVNRIVGRAIDYFRDEQEWENDDDAINYGLELYNIAVRHKDGTKWEESWLEDFKNELENF